MWYLKRLLDILNRFTEKCNDIYKNYEKAQKELEKNSFDDLKILENRKIIIYSAKHKIKKFISISFIMIFAFIVLLFLNRYFLFYGNEWIGFLYIIVLSFFLATAYNFFILFLCFCCKYLHQMLFSFLIFINAFIFGNITIGSISAGNSSNRIRSFFANSFKEYDLHNLLDFDIWKFWAIFTAMSIGLCFSLYVVLKNLDIFDLESMNRENSLIGSLLAIITFVISGDSNKVIQIGIFLLILVILTCSFTFFSSHFISKFYDEAQVIYQEQLICNFSDYKALKKCYYLGGKKYKEKLLSTEKFLEVIIKNELKSLKDLKNYDNYRLYKAIRFKK